MTRWRWRVLFPGWKLPDPPTRLEQMRDLVQGEPLKVKVKFPARDACLKLESRTKITRFEEYVNRARSRLKKSA